MSTTFDNGLTHYGTFFDTSTIVVDAYKDFNENPYKQAVWEILASQSTPVQYHNHEELIDYVKHNKLTINKKQVLLSPGDRVIIKSNIGEVYYVELTQHNRVINFSA